MKSQYPDDLTSGRVFVQASWHVHMCTNQYKVNERNYKKNLFNCFTFSSE